MCWCVKFVTTNSKRASKHATHKAQALVALKINSCDCMCHLQLSVPSIWFLDTKCHPEPCGNCTCLLTVIVLQNSERHSWCQWDQLWLQCTCRHEAPVWLNICITSKFFESDWSSGKIRFRSCHTCKPQSLERILCVFPRSVNIWWSISLSNRHQFLW